MNSKVNNSVATIVMGVTANKKSILAIPSEEKDTVEFVIDESARILVHSQGIMITANSTSNNKGMGLESLSSQPKLCRKTIRHADAKKAVDIILGLDH